MWVPGTNEHIFFNCVLAKMIWTCFKEALWWDKVPVNIQGFFYQWIPLNSKQYNAKLFIVSIVLWGISTNRNKMSIEKQFWGSSNKAFYKIFSLLQKWSKLLKDEDVKFLKRLWKTVEEWLQPFWQQTENMEVEGLLWSGCCFCW